MKLFNKLNYTVFTCATLILSNACMGGKGMDIIYYESEEFDKYVKNKAKITPIEAWNLAEEYRKKNMVGKMVGEFFLL